MPAEGSPPDAVVEGAVGEPRPQLSPPAERPAPVAWRLRVKAVSKGNAGEETVGRLLDELPDDERQLAARALLEVLDRKWLKARADKEWVRKLLAAADIAKPVQDGSRPP